MTSKKPTLLMGVYNTIEHDGRVLRAAEALSTDYNVIVMSIASGTRYSNPHFKVLPIARPFRGFLKALSLLWFWLRFTLAGLLLRPAIVYANDFFLPFAGLTAARVGNANFVYDAHELIIPEPGVRLSARNRFFYLMERLCIHRVDLVIAANAERAAMMRDHYRLLDQPLVIRNIPPLPFSRCDEDKRRIADRYPALNDRDRIRLVYQGDMALSRGIGFFVDVIREIPDRCELLLVGDGPDRNRIQQIVQASYLSKDITLLGKVPHSEVNDVIATCDIGIVTYPEKGLNNVYCAPNKIYEYAQAGIPVLTTGQPPLRSLIQKYRIGAVCRDNGRTTAAEAAQTILSVADNIPRYKKNLERFLADHRWTDEAKKLLDAVAGLRHKRTSRLPAPMADYTCKTTNAR